jgi:uncharacterized OB-fold protein
LSELPSPAPPVTPETKPFWDATAEGRLLLQRCTACARPVWYPRASCPACGSAALEWFEASGRGTVFSFTVVRRGAPGDYRDAAPYVLAYVDLEDGPRILTNIVECDPDSIEVDDAVHAVFHATGEGPALVRFRPT